MIVKKTIEKIAQTYTKQKKIIRRNLNEKNLLLEILIYKKNYRKNIYQIKKNH